MEQEKLLLSPDETCEIIGVKRSTLFKLLETGDIPSIKVGRLRRVPVVSLRNWVNHHINEQIDRRNGARSGTAHAHAEVVDMSGDEDSAKQVHA